MANPDHLPATYPRSLQRLHLRPWFTPPGIPPCGWSRGTEVKEEYTMEMVSETKALEIAAYEKTSAAIDDLMIAFSEY